MMIVFYDEKCSLYHREIEQYKRIAPDNVFDGGEITISKTRIRTSRFLLEKQS